MRSGRSSFRRSKRSKKQKRGMAAARSNRRISVRQNRVRSFGNLVAKGIRTLTSYLPGQDVVKPVTDFGLKLFGFAQSVTMSREADGRLRANADIAYTGLGGLISVYPRVVFSYCGHFPHVQSGTNTTFTTQYRSILVKQLEVKAEVIGPQASRQGMWGIAFIPFRNINDGQCFWQSFGGRVPDLRSLMGIQDAVYGSGTVLTLNARFKPVRDGRLAQPMLLEDEIGAVMIAFDDKNRDKYTDGFTQDFSVNITLRGYGVLQLPTFNDVPVSFGDKPKDWLNKVSQTLVTDAPLPACPTAPYVNLGYADQYSQSVSSGGLQTLTGYPVVVSLPLENFEMVM